jgi:hypothetical protein
VSDSHRDVRFLKDRATSAARILDDRTKVVKALADKKTNEVLKQVVKPNDRAKTLRKAGVALILAPDPVTAVPGVVMLGASFAMKGKAPLVPSDVSEEAQKILAEIEGSV